MTPMQRPPSPGRRQIDGSRVAAGTRSIQNPARKNRARALCDHTGRVASNAVISVSYNTRKLTALLLWSLHRALEAPDKSIVVVDNASTDGSVDLLTQAQDAVLCTLIASKTNLGHGAALHLALSSQPTADATRVSILDSAALLQGPTRCALRSKRIQAPI